MKMQKKAIYNLNATGILVNEYFILGTKLLSITSKILQALSGKVMYQEFSGILLRFVTLLITAY
jgi:hypothetical protein